MNRFTRNLTLATCVLIAAPLAAGCQTERSAGQTVDDASITAKVKSQLLADPEVSAMNVNVTTYRGQVQLSGFVGTEQARERAAKIAKEVSGVRSVNNDLIVRAGAQQEPATSR